jgi:Tfp pilus assembly protein PilN
MRGIAADTMNSNYSNYLNKFNKNMQSNKSFKARNTGVNQQANNETANLAFGNTDTTQVANKSKTSKKFKKYLAGTGSDESSNKRTFYS